MKKRYISFCLLLAIGTATVYANEGIDEAARTIDQGVVINGVRWATRNVDAPGTFAYHPENPGMFYQWNRKIGWRATRNVRGWDSSMPTGDTWTRANDPCPAGWRVPTQAEIQSLDNTYFQWTNVNDISGGWFTDKNSGNNIFLPAAGWRNRSGTLGNAGTLGYYWSNTSVDGGTRARTLNFGSTVVGVVGTNRVLGFSVRCVSDD